jgi:bilirubin oxidase
MKPKVLLAALAITALGVTESFAAFVPGGTLDPTTVPKYRDALPIPQAMPKSGTIGSGIDFYKIAVRQFPQQLLPSGLPATTVWGYGSVDAPNSFSYPARTIEAKVNRPVRVNWINDLKDSKGKFLRHLLPIDQTLHWANPAQDCIDGMMMTDCRGQSQLPYDGPVPIVTHLHGAHVGPDSDGYPEAWYLPNANNIPAGYAKKGSHYGQIPNAPTAAGQALYQYPNDQRATTLWYHDHALGMTRANVYTGLAGFYLIRDPAKDPAGLPKGDHEIPVLIQDKSFNSNGSLFFPDNRAFFEGLDPSQLQIPFIPEQASGGRSDVAPIWNPEFFGNTILVNGKTWPKLNVEANRYRLRIVNGNDTRVMILKIVADDPMLRPGTPAVPFWQIGADGGYLPKPVKLNELLIAPAERVDLIVDFTNIPKGTQLYLINEGPDSPFGGGRAPVDFDFADPATTGQVMKFVVGSSDCDNSTPPANLTLPARTKLGTASKTRTLSLNEAESETVPVVVQADGSIVFAPNDPAAVPFAPVEALLGTATVTNGVITPTPLEWMNPITENPNLGATEVWEIYNFTEDAHPIHIHQTQFEVKDRQAIAFAADGTATLSGTPTPPEAGETGTKDTVLVYPGMVTRVKAKFDLAGLFVWHCHIISHEDNEMMRPMCVGPLSNCK